MARQPETNNDTYHDVFPMRLRETMERQSVSQTDLAKRLQKSRQAIGYYCDGSAKPSWKIIAQIAQYLGVSSDYLLGLTDVPFVDMDDRSASEYTGLHHDALHVLQIMSIKSIDSSSDDDLKLNDDIVDDEEDYPMDEPQYYGTYNPFYDPQNFPFRHTKGMIKPMDLINALIMHNPKELFRALTDMSHGIYLIANSSQNGNVVTELPENRDDLQKNSGEIDLPWIDVGRLSIVSGCYGIMNLMKNICDTYVDKYHREIRDEEED